MTSRLIDDFPQTTWPEEEKKQGTSMWHVRNFAHVEWVQFYQNYNLIIKILLLIFEQNVFFFHFYSVFQYFTQFCLRIYSLFFFLFFSRVLIQKFNNSKLARIIFGLIFYVRNRLNFRYRKNWNLMCLLLEKL